MNFGIIILKLSMFFGIYVIYIIFKLNGFSRNLRTELKRAKKFYFEMKWNPKRANTKFPVSFLSAYQVKDKCIVTPENWIDWVIE